MQQNFKHVIPPHLLTILTRGDKTCLKYINKYMCSGTGGAGHTFFSVSLLSPADSPLTNLHSPSNTLASYKEITSTSVIGPITSPIKPNSCRPANIETRIASGFNFMLVDKTLGSAICRTVTVEA